MRFPEYLMNIAADADRALADIFAEIDEVPGKYPPPMGPLPYRVL